MGVERRKRKNLGSAKPLTRREKAARWTMSDDTTVGEEHDKGAKEREGERRRRSDDAGRCEPCAGLHSEGAA